MSILALVRPLSRMFRLRGLLVFAALPLLLAACGGGSSNEALIVYEAKGPDKHTNIYTIDSGGKYTKQLTFGDSFDANPGWTPDRNNIVFVSDRDKHGQSEVYTMDASGGNPRRLTETDVVSNWSPKFSPDASRIAWISVTKTGSFLSLMDADGSNQQRVGPPYKFAEFPAWTRDGAQIFFAAIDSTRNDPDLFSYDVASGEIKRRISTPAADVCPHFTRDGTTLTYASTPSGSDNAGNIDLFAHDLSSDDTTGAPDTRLTTDPAVDDYANPSPDDRTFVFLSKRDGNTELYLMDRDGQNQRRLTTTPDMDENVPDW